MSDFKMVAVSGVMEEEVVISGNESDKYSGLFDIDITDALIKKALKKVNLEQEHIDNGVDVPAGNTGKEYIEIDIEFLGNQPPGLFFVMSPSQVLGVVVAIPMGPPYLVGTEPALNIPHQSLEHLHCRLVMAHTCESSDELFLC